MSLPVKTLRIHVGLPKCGSSTLQNSFSETCKALYLGRKNREFINGDIQRFSREIAPSGDIRMLDRRYYRHAFATVFEQSEHELALISDEVLSSIGFATDGRGNSLPQIIENFSRVIDCPIEIILVVREQMSFLRSYYTQIVKGQHDFSLNEFLALVLLCKERWVFPMLDFAKVIRRVSAQVNKVHVIPFEELFFNETAGTDFLEQIGVPDVIDKFHITHENRQHEEFKVGQQVSIKRTAGGRGNDSKPSMVNPTDWLRVNKPASDDDQMHNRLLRDLIQRRIQHRKTLEEFSEFQPPLLGKDLLALDSALERTLLNYFKRSNRKLVEQYPEFDWQALGYAM